jgi:hypothetical protein
LLADLHVGHHRQPEGCYDLERQRMLDLHGLPLERARSCGARGGTHGARVEARPHFAACTGISLCNVCFCHETKERSTDGPGQIVSYLPLSHIAAQALDIIFPIVGTAGLGEGESRSFQIQTYFARPDALKGSLKDTLAVARPTIFFAVPRVWEKFADVIQAKGRAMKGTMMGSISAWAKGTVSQAYKEAQAGGSSGWTPVGYTIASNLVSKARAALGLDRCNFLYTGAAPITKETLEYFGSIGISILELYGMSENTGPMTVSNARPNGSAIGAAVRESAYQPSERASESFLLSCSGAGCMFVGATACGL